MQFRHTLLPLSMLAQSVLVALPAQAAEPRPIQAAVSADDFDPRACIWQHGSKKHPGHWTYGNYSGPNVTQDCDAAANDRPHVIYGISPDTHQRIRMEGRDVVVVEAQAKNPCLTAGLLTVALAVGECPVSYGYGYYGGFFGGSYGYGWGYGYGSRNPPAPLNPPAPVNPPLPPHVRADRNPPAPVNPPAPGHSVSAQATNAALETTSRANYTGGLSDHQTSVHRQQYTAQVAQDYNTSPRGYQGGYGVTPGTYPTVGTSQQPAGIYDPVNHPLGANGIPEAPYNPVTTDYNGRGQPVATYDYNRNGTSYGSVNGTGASPNGASNTSGPNGTSGYRTMYNYDDPPHPLIYNDSDINAANRPNPKGRPDTFETDPSGIRVKQNSMSIKVVPKMGAQHGMIGMGGNNGGQGMPNRPNGGSRSFATHAMSHGRR